MEHSGDEIDPRDEARARLERIERLLKQLKFGKKKQFTLEKFANNLEQRLEMRGRESEQERAEFLPGDFRPRNRERRPDNPPSFGPAEPGMEGVKGENGEPRHIDIEIPFYPELAPRAAKGQKALNEKGLKDIDARLTEKIRTALEKELGEESLKSSPREVILVHLNIGIYVRELEETKQGITIVKERMIIHRFVMAYDPEDSGAAE